MRVQLLNIFNFQKWELNSRHDLFEFMDPIVDIFNFSPLDYRFWETHIQQEWQRNNSPRDEDDEDSFLQKHDHSPYL